MFFSKKNGEKLDNQKVCYDVKKLKKEEKIRKKESKTKKREEKEINSNNNLEANKIKLSKRTIFRIVLVIIVILIVLGVIGHIEIQKRDKEEIFSKSLSSFINGNYDVASIKLKDIKPKTDDEKAYIELMNISRNIPSKASYFSDKDIILEYIDVLEQMKELVNKNSNITINIYKNKKHKEITITEIAFNDAIRYAEEKISELEEGKINILNKKNPITTIMIDQKMIGYFVNMDNIKGNGDSYYKNQDQ